MHLPRLCLMGMSHEDLRIPYFLGQQYLSSIEKDMFMKCGIFLYLALISKDCSHQMYTIP